ncbi:hypothetical protein QJQ45_023698 [Haematococcus lacustris]|nr:hypothetical protein QJQ45_023698 [Haematococcus lacustris]
MAAANVPKQQVYNSLDLAADVVLRKALASKFANDWLFRYNSDGIVVCQCKRCPPNNRAELSVANMSQLAARHKCKLEDAPSISRKRSPEPSFGPLPREDRGAAMPEGIQRAVRRRIGLFLVTQQLPFNIMDNVHLQSVFQLLGVDVYKEKHYRTQLLDELYSEVKQATFKELRKLAKGDLDDLQAAHQCLQDEHTALQQVASNAAATNHSLRGARRRLQGQVHIYRHKRRPHHSPLTFKQRQQLLVLEQHPVSVEVLRRCAEAGYGRLDGQGRPMGSMAEQLSPAGLAPSPTDIFIPTQEGPVGRPAARTAPYNAHHCLSTVTWHLETGVIRRALSKCRQFFVSEQRVLPNPHRPGKTSTVGREFHIVSTYMQRKTLVASAPAAPTSTRQGAPAAVHKAAAGPTSVAAAADAKDGLRSQRPTQLAHYALHCSTPMCGIVLVVVLVHRCPPKAHDVMAAAVGEAVLAAAAMVAAVAAA